MRVIYYEGLFGVLFRWLYRGLIRDIKEAHPDWEFESRHWLNRELIDDPNAVVIGHSFGAAAAVRNTKGCELLVTLDCRTGFSDEFKSGVKSGNHVNFYQIVGLRGYQVDGAVNRLVDSSHLGLVTHPEVYMTVLSYLDGLG